MLDEDGLHGINIIGTTFVFGVPVLAQSLAAPLARYQRNLQALTDATDYAFG